MKNKILCINNLNKIYYSLNNNVLAVKDVSIDLYDKEIISIVGPSGCGKSTILSIIAGLNSQTHGKVLTNKSIGIMLQKDALLPYLNILDNTLIGIKMRRKVLDSDIEFVKNLLNKYGLSDFIYKYPNSLSGGMRQRVSLIRTLALKPDIILFDEALSALDYQTKLYISKDIYNIIRELGLSAIFVTHDIEDAVAISDRIYVLSSKPATVKNIYEINIYKNNPIDARSDSNFRNYVNNIWKDLDINE